MPRPRGALFSGLRHDSAFWRRALAAGVRRGPEPWVRHSPPVFGVLFAAALPELRRRVEQNLRRVRGPRSRLVDLLDSSRGVRRLRKLHHRGAAARERSRVHGGAALPGRRALPRVRGGGPGGHHRHRAHGRLGHRRPDPRRGAPGGRHAGDAARTGRRGARHPGCGAAARWRPGGAHRRRAARRAAAAQAPAARRRGRDADRSRAARDAQPGGHLPRRAAGVRPRGRSRSPR